MAVHVIVGAGPVGSGVARLLAAAGHEVRVLTRSGGGAADLAGHPAVRRERVDAADAAALTRAASGADVLYNCVNPPYHRWASDWPPVADALLTAAAASGAVLVTMANLYGYGEVSAPMTEDTPLAATGVKGQVRNRMWADALAAHRAGRVRVTEARASDFYGPGAVANAVLGERFAVPVLAGRTAWVIGDPDAPHSWSYLPDVAAALVLLGSDERAWGRAWHVPAAPPASQREMARGLARAAGAPEPTVRAIPAAVMSAAGLVSPALRELRETRHQFTRPFVLDSTAYTETFGVTATPAAEALEATAAWWRARAATPAAA
ncbi:MAG TPA: NAD-dependent epimerase/dehydratase family protein [Pseudonocardiaceae bacterium]